MRGTAFKRSRSFAWILSVTATIILSGPNAKGDSGASDSNPATNVAGGYFDFQDMGREAEDGFTLSSGAVTQIALIAGNPDDPHVSWHLQCQDANNNPYAVWSVTEHLSVNPDYFGLLTDFPKSNTATLSYHADFNDDVGPRSGDFGPYGTWLWEMSQDWGALDIEGYNGYYDYFVQTDDVYVAVGYQTRNAHWASTTP